MAINRVQEPSNPPTAIGDWSKIIAEIRALALAIEGPLRVVGANVVKGAVFQIGGTLYLADGDTGIAGTASAYVKITPSGDGSTCTAMFVASLTGVTWNSTYNGWYDGGSPDSLYVFDEAYAFKEGQIAAIMDVRNIAPGVRASKVPITTGSEWANTLAANLAAGWRAALAAVPNSAVANNNADTVDGYHASSLSLWQGLNGQTGSVGTEGSFVATYASPVTIGAGLYMLAKVSGGGNIQMYSAGVWGGCDGGLILSDGGNYRAVAPLDQPGTWVYRKLL